MKKSQKMTISAFALAAVALVGSQMAVNAYQGDYTKKGPEYSDERHQAMTEAFENNDYNAWAELMDGRGRVTGVITEENFAQFAQAHRLAIAGDYEAADEIRSELGLRTRDGRGGGKGHGRGNSEFRGQNKGGNFVDTNGDGTCDNM